MDKKNKNHSVNIFKELKEINRAFKNMEKIKAGKLKGRPAEELLNEL